jgi:coenzyme PQQ synthesis protein D (PqqD)
MIDATFVPRKNPQVAYRALAAGEGGVILHLESGQYHGIDDVGCTIWELIDGSRTAREIADAVREQVDDAPPQLLEDVASFLEGMRERDLLVV